MKHCLTASIRKIAVPGLLLALVCMALSSCSFSFSLDDALTQLKAYINGTEVSQPPVDFVESRENESYRYDVYLDRVIITEYLGTEVEVEIPAKIDKLPVREIASLTFYDGVAVESVTVPEGVTVLDENAFYYCTALVSVSLPDSLTEIGDKAFSWCSSLEKVKIPDAVTKLPAYCFNQCTSLRSVSLPGGITEVGARAFSGCAVLETLYFGDAVAEIGSFAFRDCPLLKTIRLPGTCQLGEQTFAGCAEGFTVMTELESACWETCTSLGVMLKEDDGSLLVPPETSEDTSEETSDELVVID